MATPSAFIKTSSSFLQNIILKTIMSQQQQSYSDFVTPIMHAEFDMASEYDTKKTICERAAKKITTEVHQILQVPVQSSSRAVVHPDIAKMIEDYYKSIIMENKSAKMDDLKMRFAVFKSTDCLEPHVIKNLIREFIKYSQDPNKCNDNTLNVILAVDGMSGARPNDLTNYIPNLASVSDSHIEAIREMYRHSTEIVGTDAVYMIRKCLLEVYGECNRNGDHEVMVRKEQDNVDKYFKEKGIDQEELCSTVSHCKGIYLEKVGDELERFCIEKLSTFWNYLKRRVETKNNKRKLEKEEEEEKEVKDEKEREKKEAPPVKKAKAHKDSNKKSKK